MKREEIGDDAGGFGGWMGIFGAARGRFQQLGFRCGACRGGGSAALDDEI